MDVSHLLDGLNEAQREAVTSTAPHNLVLAGAGSGKTRVLIHRLAWLIQVEHVSPLGILAVTFTNKAAGEMRERAQDLLEVSTRPLWIGTFHGIAHRLLRMHWREAGLPEQFQILDSEDQQRLIKRLMRDEGMDENQWPARQAQWFINQRKDEGQRPDAIETEGHPLTAGWTQIYQLYQDYCDRAGLVDFAELLLCAHELWLNNDELLAHYRNRLRHILVDEFQDTNTIQYAWIRMLAGSSGQTFVVGDDDQSIYGWRGARVENVRAYTRDFPDVKTVRLEQNYRSTGNILSAANGLIAHNESRMGKNLWTDDEPGQPIRIYAAFNEQEEARFVVSQLRQWIDEGRRASDAAIVYRTSAQSRLFEEFLMRESVPYRVYGGLRFFERAEIKDALSYLRLVQNPNDDAALERVINTPNRGIGQKTVETLRMQSRETGLPLWQAAGLAIEQGVLSGRARTTVAAFMRLVTDMRERLGDWTMGNQVQGVIDMSDLASHYEKESREKMESRMENLRELVNAADAFVIPADDEEAGMTPLQSFLSRAALEAGETQGEEWDDCVQLMTLHSAKGLEFPLVFMAGMEDGLFPHQRSVTESGGKLEEERRLCYVGMTRAMEQLYMTYAEVRRMFGSENYSRPSRFLGEIPAEHLQEIRPRAQVSQPWVAAKPARAPIPGHDDGMPFKHGQRVHHRKFGEGTVITFEGSGEHARVQVNFNHAGTKWLVLAYANLDSL
ncbi:DNA helicase II [Marinihelvus fidelis]|uniref:DNA 3'-5' helicase n=1 Tax=Marinihelvus fidelis TaxID=2613842 RepID=A0A5N0T7H3_9GAMM|nr:DNA helicase II [Marinihelvus fidelis]KAA9130995.1 DNA helicase II [Marinihelvus fidelis]